MVGRRFDGRHYLLDRYTVICRGLGVQQRPGSELVWWGFGLAHVAMAVVFAPLWRRSGVMTDAAFTELRY